MKKGNLIEKDIRAKTKSDVNDELNKIDSLKSKIL
jgi:hypothetical protein